MTRSKPKVCADSECEKTFTQYNSLQKYCSSVCAYKNSKKTKKAKQKVYKGVNDLNVKSEIDFYFEIWNSRKQRSFLSNQRLNFAERSEFWYNCFAHVLSKSQSKYPKFKLYSKNLILLTPEEHHLLDHGTEMQRQKYAKKYGCDWQKVYGLREELVQEYNNL